MARFALPRLPLATIGLVAAALVLGAAASPARAALIFNFSFDSTINATNFGSNVAALEADAAAVGATYSNLYTNNVTLNIGFTADTTPGALASSSATYDQTAIYSYSAIRSDLIANASTPASISATNALPLIDPSILQGGYIVPSAEGKALGLVAANASGSDGTVNVGTNIGSGSNWDFAGTSTPAANDYSFMDAIEHEISELMGRTTQLTNSGWPWNGPMDLLRCTRTSPTTGVINMSPTATGVYFSTDGCATDAKDYNPPNSNGADIQDFASSSTPDPYDAYGTPGAYAPLSPIDQQVMNTLGWQSPSPVPEPMSLAILLPGVIGLIGLRRRGRRAQAV